MISDIKYAFRQFAKHPGFTAAVVLILALGIGSNTAVFTFIDTILLRALPVHDPEQLVLVGKTGVTRTDRSSFFSYYDYEQFRDHAQSLAGTIAVRGSDPMVDRHTGRSFVASGLDQNEVLSVSTGDVSGNFFSVLGVQPYLGRTLDPDDNRTGAARAVTVLSYAFWHDHFAADPAVLGKPVRIDNIPFLIVGIAPPEFSGVELGAHYDLWIPIQMFQVLETPIVRAGMREKHSSWLNIIGRLKPGVKRETAIAELNGIYQAGLADDHVSVADKNLVYGKIDLQTGGAGFGKIRGQVRSLLAILMAAVGLVLVVACANVASLVLARTAVRQREFALRSALGAARGRLIRQLMIESGLMVLAGGLLGLLAADWGTEALAGYLPEGRSLDFHPDRGVLLFATAISAVTVILIGVIPALRFSRLDLVSTLKDQAHTTAGGSRPALGRSLVASQIALSLCLLTGTGLFVRTLQNLKNVDLGFRREHLLLVDIAFDRNYDATRKSTLAKNVRDGLETLPDVTGATLSDGGLLSNSVSQPRIAVDGYVPQSDEDSRAYATNVGPHFFETLGIPSVSGRGFTDAEVLPSASKAQGVVVINEGLARKYFRNVDPIGHIIRLGGVQPYRIVGVVKNSKYQSLREKDSMEIYLPVSKNWARNPFHAPEILFELRTTGSPHALAPSIRSLLHRIDPNVRVLSSRTMDDVVEGMLFQERMIAQIAGFFSLFALVLAAMGLYGVLAYNVTQRTREIGIRMALGAQIKDVLALVIKQGMAIALAGCVIGTVAAIALSHLVASKLYGVTATDPLTFSATASLLLIVALVACWIPARRAARVDPLVALRAE